MTGFLPQNEGEAVAAAVAAAVASLRRGEVVAVPTDTVYGLVATLDNGAALFEAKRRPHGVDLPVLCADRAQAQGLAAGPLPDDLAARWPGPLTLVVRRAASLTADLGEHHETVGIRVPNHPVPRELARLVGPLASTSANLHGAPPATTAAEVRSQLGASVRLVIDGGVCDGKPSTVLDCTGPQPQVLRG